ncbi:MAG: hypothetical protein JXA45_02455 [Methanomassiliicoccales archaeon]|nr:hypothetical protein [Methanomassiliicoccales archaeon]
MPPVSLRNILPFSPKSRSEAERVEPILVESLASPLSIERKRMEGRVLDIAKEEPEAMVTVLLRNLDTKHGKARESIEGLLKEIANSREGHAALLENLSHPEKEVRKGLHNIMVQIWGEPAGTFATNYEQAVFFVNLAKGRDIYADDILTLMELAKVTLVEGERERAYEDIVLILDLVKHRYRSVETMKNYLAEMLRVTPEISRLGMMSGRIEESLRTAVKANKQRKYDYTKQLIDQRMKEVDIIDQVRALGMTVKDKLSETPHVRLEDMNATDVWAFGRLKELVQRSSSLSLTGFKTEVIEVLDDFLRDEFQPFLQDRAQDRLKANDPSLMYTIYTVGLACLKLLKEALPKVAEEMYVTYFRELEGTPNLEDVPWPSTVL